MIFNIVIKDKKNIIEEVSLFNHSINEAKEYELPSPVAKK